MIDTTRPEGQPGTAWYGEDVESDYFPGETVRLGLSYPAVQSGDALWLWRDTRWILAPGYLPYFEAGPDWQEHCPHEHGAPWRTCDSEAACIALKREEAR